MDTNTGIANRKMPNQNGWADRHDAAWGMQGPSCHVRIVEKNAPFLMEQAMTAMLKGWQLYAETHCARYGDTISNDGFLGREWLDLGKSLRALLNGETGRLDCGTLDAFILDTLSAAGFSESDL